MLLCAGILAGCSPESAESTVSGDVSGNETSSGTQSDGTVVNDNPYAFVNPHTERGEATVTKTPLIIETVNPTDDTVVADYVVTDTAYGADNHGIEDSSNAIQQAIKE